MFTLARVFAAFMGALALIALAPLAAPLFAAIAIGRLWTSAEMHGAYRGDAEAQDRARWKANLTN